MISARVVDHFWDGFDMSGGPEACWPWTRCRDDKGYGRRFGGGLPRLTHRAAFTIVNGAPAGHVLHRCDNPPCGNPAHLYDGDDAANARDREERGRGRQSRGEDHGRAVLTEELVERVLVMRAGGASYSAIMAATGLRKHNVYQVATGKTWRHVRPDLSR